MMVLAVAAGTLGFFWLVRIVVTTIQSVVYTVDTVTSWNSGPSHS